MSVEVQLAAPAHRLPKVRDFRRWAKQALQGERGDLCVRVVDANESQALNGRYRGIDAPTNVLSFPAAANQPSEAGLLGDIVVCAPVVEAEAARQEKAPAEHFAHMVVHGVLHLRGHDHEAAAAAEAMEKLETAILNELGMADPHST
ncbi:MAG: rRNA maturation RNase YbeY [Gammaproteobacteria bacterium]|nr:rRNA maturation RNase YbeY [Gammaproteobacteria bacterium]MXW50308.1 rRNA maturation RNase YbeY [Gammaproteobacteria bacterium]MYE50084.1 rRNA maturation RNase YbeY [Gammaproteobacteria bacterium]MYF51926.1 rRNA maturation RNase YbeY [Gammaproteobacteria bacterium]MYG11758.1 rRNA maturation RNase YbeY [Gammaproteobacteria bacterium]